MLVLHDENKTTTRVPFLNELHLENWFRMVVKTNPVYVLILDNLILVDKNTYLTDVSTTCISVSACSSNLPCLVSFMVAAVKNERLPVQGCGT
jgi:hypothetical protein